MSHKHLSLKSTKAELQGSNRRTAYNSRVLFGPKCLTGELLPNRISVISVVPFVQFRGHVEHQQLSPKLSKTTGPKGDFLSSVNDDLLRRRATQLLKRYRNIFHSQSD